MRAAVYPSGRVDVQRVQPGCEFGLQSVIHGPMFRQPREPGKGVSPDFHSIVGLAPRCCASMTVVQM